ncbi:MAG: hypothetical protein JWN70_3379 [Planctomycetaceae bacterium]|nr:hypothetical protein [Planctomycetaceae bacterium]
MVYLTNPLLHFSESLWAGGDLVLMTNSPASSEEVAHALRELQSREAAYRLGLPQGCPELNEVAAEWALMGLYRASQYLAYRELPEDQLRADLSCPCPAAPDPSVCYSVDLSFRFLPEIVRLARAASGNQLLLECLLLWATDWPLSSVNIPDLTPGPLEPFLGNPGLLTLYIDRIVAGNDQSRLADERVTNAVRTALGGFRELAPVLYDAVHSKIS